MCQGLIRQTCQAPHFLRRGFGSPLQTRLRYARRWKIRSHVQGPYIVRKVLEKGAYELVDCDGIPLSEPRNGLYLKKYYA
jgi:hypothetical protein